MSQLETTNFNRLVSLSEASHHHANIAANDAFVLAMARAVRRGKEKVTVGTFVDLSPNFNAIRIYGDVAMSPCGSPAAMCTEAGGTPSGAQTMR